MHDAMQRVAQSELEQRVRWLISLRWLAAGGLFVAVGIVEASLRVDIPLVPFYSGNAALLVLNGLYELLYRRLKGREPVPRRLSPVVLLATAQISVDLVLLTFLIHFSGGLDNPFVVFFVFHMVIASILLSNRNAYLQATLASLLFALVFGGEQAGILRHYQLPGFLSYEPGRRSWPAWLVEFLALSAALYITVYLSTTVVDRLRQRERDLEDANRQLLSKDRLKSQYVMTVSHDIRGSLSVIRTCLRVVLGGYTEPVPGKGRDMIERAEHRTERLLTFVKDLLNLSRMRAAEDLERRPVAVWGVLQRVVEQLRPLSNEKNLTVETQNRAGAATVWANEEAIEQVTANLLGNAIRYTPAGGSIFLSMEETPDSGGVLVSVKDTGIGIPPAALPHIFEDFYRAENAKKWESDGTGLGLSIVNHIVEAHGGRLSVESQIPGGSTFRVTLPRAGKGGVPQARRASGSGDGAP